VIKTKVSVPGNKYKYWRYRIFFITWLAYVGFYLTRKSFSVAKIGMSTDPDIMLTKLQMSQIDAAYLIAYAVGQFVWGIFGDKFGARKIILIGMLVSILTAFLMGASSLVVLLGVFFCIQGFCQSTGWAPLTKNISYWFSQKERGVVMGWWCSNYAVGGLIASPFAGFCADYFTNWRFGFFGPAVALFVVCAMFFVLQVDRPEDIGLPKIEKHKGEKEAILDLSEETPKKTGNLQSARNTKQTRNIRQNGVSLKFIISVLKNPMVLILGAVYFCLKPTRYAIFFWGPLYINEKLGTGMTESAIISVFFELGGPIGVLVAGYLSDKVFESKRIPVCVICLILLALVLFFFNYFVGFHSKFIVALLLFMIGFLLYAPDSLVSGTAAIDFGTSRGASTAAGFINGCGSVSAIMGGALPGLVALRWGWGPLFITLGAAVFVAGLMLIPKWNAVPKVKSAQ